MSLAPVTENRERTSRNGSNVSHLGEGILENEQHADPEVAVGLTLMQHLDESTVKTLVAGVVTPPTQKADPMAAAPTQQQQSVQGQEPPKKRETYLLRAARKLTSNIEPLFSPSRRTPKPAKPWKYKQFKRPRFVRLLCLQSDLSTLPELFSFSLDSPYLPYYTTLSYHGGPFYEDGSHLTHVLKCRKGPIRISENLRHALDRIYETQSVWTAERRKLQWLWVDSICVNLADPAERSAQVALMPEIYARCEQMIVWLGEHSDSTKQWLNNLQTISPGLDGTMFWPKSASKFEQRLTRLPETKKEDLKTRLGHPPDALPARWIAIYEDHVLGIPRPAPDATDAEEQQQPLEDVHLWMAPFRRPRDRQFYVELLQRPWFSRKWVNMEMAQTRGKHRHFLTANQIQSYEEMEAGLKEFSLKNSALPFTARSLNNTLLQNLFKYGETHCSEPRDHIYALLGISNDVSWLMVDYTQNVESLYTDVAEYYVKNGNLVPILTLATVQTAPRRLPSWVPDWRESWRCDRSTRHAEVMKTLASGERRLWREAAAGDGDNGISAGTTTPPPTIQYDSKKPTGLKLKAWIIPNCSHGDRAESNECRKCKVLASSRGKRASRDGDPPPEAISYSPSPMQAESEKKWGPVIREQFNMAMHAGEVLCLLDNCAVGFVLRPARNNNNSIMQNMFSETAAYRLEFCFQVDEGGAMTHWFASKLGVESQEWICIV